MTDFEMTLPSGTTILMTREFAAPAHLVYRAWTTPDLVRQWWSGQRGTVTDVEIDLRVGGRWRYVMETGDGNEIAFHGEYREIVPNEKIVHTEVFETPGTTADDTNTPLNTVTFTEKDGRTLLTMLVDCPTGELRDAIVGSGMDVGVREQFEQLDHITASLR